MLADDLFEKALQKIVTCLSVNNSLWGKLPSSLQKALHDNPRVTSVAFFVSGFIYSALKLIDLRLQYFIESIYTNAKINLWNKFTYFTVPCEKSRKACLTYEDHSCVCGTILVKLICCMTFRPASGFCCLIRSLAISLSFSFKYE